MSDPAAAFSEPGRRPPFELDADSYDAGYEASTPEGHRLRARSRAAAALLGEGPGSVLEVGMGAGRLLEALSARGWEVAGVDSSPRMVELAGERVPDARVTGGLAEKLPWADSEFDAAVIVGVLAYTDVDATIAELVRVVRPGGRLVIGFRNRAAPVYTWRRTVVHPVARGLKRIVPFGRPPVGRRRTLSLAQIKELLSARGLRIERIEPAGTEVIPDPLDRLSPELAHRAAEAAERRPGLRRFLGSHRLVLARRPA